MSLHAIQHKRRPKVGTALARIVVIEEFALGGGDRMRMGLPGLDLGQQAAHEFRGFLVGHRPHTARRQDLQALAAHVLAARGIAG